MAELDLDTFADLPVPKSTRLIDFTVASVSSPDGGTSFLLYVTGWKPWFTMRVLLFPLPYGQRPDYCQIEVVGTLPVPIGEPLGEWYGVAHDVTQIRGTKGVQVMGATVSKTIDI